MVTPDAEGLFVSVFAKWLSHEFANLGIKIKLSVVLHFCFIFMVKIISNQAFNFVVAQFSRKLTKYTIRFLSKMKRIQK